MPVFGFVRDCIRIYVILDVIVLFFIILDNQILFIQNHKRKKGFFYPYDPVKKGNNFFVFIMYFSVYFL